MNYNITRAPTPNVNNCEITGKWSKPTDEADCKACLNDSDSFYCGESNKCVSKYSSDVCSMNSTVAKVQEQCSKPCKQFAAPTPGGGCSDKFDCDYKNGQTCEQRQIDYQGGKEIRGFCVNSGPSSPSNNYQPLYFPVDPNSGPVPIQPIPTPIPPIPTPIQPIPIPIENPDDYLNKLLTGDDKNNKQLVNAVKKVIIIFSKYSNIKDEGGLSKFLDSVNNLTCKDIDIFMPYFKKNDPDNYKIFENFMKKEFKNDLSSIGNTFNIFNCVIDSVNKNFDLHISESDINNIKQNMVKKILGDDYFVCTNSFRTISIVTTIILVIIIGILLYLYITKK